MDLLHEASFDFVGDFDAASAAASLDLLGNFDGGSASLDLLGDVPHSCNLQSSDPQPSLAHAPTQSDVPNSEKSFSVGAEPPSKPQSQRQTQAEKNRRYQKTFRHNQRVRNFVSAWTSCCSSGSMSCLAVDTKQSDLYHALLVAGLQAKFHGLKEELAAKTALVERLQAENHRLKTRDPAVTASQEPAQQGAPLCVQSDFPALQQVRSGFAGIDLLPNAYLHAIGILHVICSSTSSTHAYATHRGCHAHML